MGAIRISLFLSIALFALLSIGIANASLTITSNSITTPIDYPQNAIYTINGISGGVLPYTFNAYYTNANVPANNVFLGSNTFSPGAYNAIIITITPNSISPNSILITAYNGIVGAANVLFSNTISTGTSTIYGSWTFNAFFADSTGASANTISSSNTLTINPTPTITLTPSNTVLDSGQTETYTMTVKGGTGPFNVELYNITGSAPVAVNSVIISSPGGSNTISFTVNSPTSGNTFTYNAIATDTGTSTPYIFSSSSNTITVNPSLSVSISPTSATYDAGQTISLTATPSGGTSPYSYQWYNDTSGTANAISGATSNTFSTPANSIPIKIILTNSQSIATNAPFQQIINISESSYPSLTYNSVFADFEYTYANGTVIPAWIESNNSGIITTWVKIAKGIPANSNITIYLNIKPGVNLLSNSGTTGIGEAPQLSPVYGEYDDGTSVFNYYDNFAGTSLTGWVSNTLTYTFNSIYANNGLYINSNGTFNSDQNIYYNKEFATPFILEADLVSIFNNGGSPSITMSEGSSSSADLPAGGLLLGGYGFSFYNPTGSQLVYATSTSTFEAVNTLPPISTPTIIGLSWNAIGNENVFYNYRNVLYSTNNSVTLGPNNYIEFGFDSGAYYTKGEFQWVRIRALPPNGVMPSVSFASQYKYYVVVTDSASTPTSATSSTGAYTVNPALSVSISPTSRTYDAGQTITLTATPSGGTPPYSYQWYNDTSGTANAISGATSPTYSATASATGTFKYYVVVKDSATTPTSANSLAGTYIVNNALSVSISPTSRTYDAGQTITLTAIPSGGTPPYSYQWYNSTLYSSTSTVLPIIGAITSTYSATASATGTFKYYVVVGDSATTPTSAQSTNGTYYINPTPTATSLTPSNTILDSGQYVTYNVVINGGTLPITANLIYVGGPSNTVINGNVPGNVLQTVTLPVGSAEPNIITFNSFELTTPGSYTFNVVAVDSANTPVTFNAVANTITVNAAPTATLLTPSNTILDSGQYVTYNVSISGGTLPITANLVLVSNSIPIQINGANAVPGNTYNTIVTSSDGVITFNSLSITTSNSIGGSVTFNVIAVDSANTPVTFNAVANTITVNPALSKPSTPQSLAEVDQGQEAAIEDFELPPLGGSGTVTYTWLVSYNSSAYAPATSSQCAIPSGTASNGLIVFCQTTASTPPGTYTYEIQFKDSASTPETTTSVPSGTTTVNPAPYITLTATPSNSIMYGVLTVNALITGGTGNFAVYWFINGNAISSNSITTVLSRNVSTSYTTPPAVGNYIYKVEANDIGTTTSVYTLTPVTNTIIVAQNNTLSASSSGNPGSSYYSYPVTIIFTGTPTINHQAKWSLYVNGALYGTTNSTIKYYEQFAPPGTYNFVFNLTSDANYTPYTYTTSLLISYPPTGTYGTTTTVTTATTTVTTTSIPTTSVTTTIPPSQKAISITSNISSSSPLVLNLPNARSSVYIYTTSTTSAPIVANIINVTQQVSSLAKPKPNYTLINAVNLSIITTAPITLFFVEHYPCSIPSDLVVPYIFKNNTWLAIANYTVNATACTVSFNIPSDPIVAIFEKSVPTTTTTSIATTIPTTIYYPSPSPKPSSPIVVEALILIIILIAIILVLLYYYKLLHRKYHGFKR